MRGQQRRSIGVLDDPELAVERRDEPSLLLELANRRFARGLTGLEGTGDDVPVAASAPHASKQEDLASVATGNEDRDL